MLDIKKHLSDYTSGNWDSFKASLAPDCVYEEEATMQRAKKPDDYIKLVQAWKRGFPDLKVNILGMYTSGDRAFLEVEWEGTHTAPFEGPFGTLAPTNKHGTLRAALFYTVKGDKITELHHYFDLLTMLRQLGIAPSMGAQAPAGKTAEQPRH